MLNSPVSSGDDNRMTAVSAAEGVTVGGQRLAVVRKSVTLYSVENRERDVCFRLTTAAVYVGYRSGHVAPFSGAVRCGAVVSFCACNLVNRVLCHIVRCVYQRIVILVYCSWFCVADRESGSPVLWHTALALNCCAPVMAVAFVAAGECLSWSFFALLSLDASSLDPSLSDAAR